MNYQIMSLSGADELIKIKTKHMSLLDTSKIEYLYELGYKTAKKRLNKLTEKCNI